MNVRRWLTAVAVFVTAVLGTFTLGAPTAQAAECSGVWVVVAGQGTKCATSHGTGKAALQNAGFATKDKSPGFLCQINGSPAKCVITNDAYWSYWQATRNADGTWGKWTYSNLGYTSTKPKKGNAEGWVFGNGNTPPPAPPKNAVKPPPAPSTSAPAPSKPEPAPTTSAPKPADPKPAPSKPATTKASSAPTKTKPAVPAASQPAAEPEGEPEAAESAPGEAAPSDSPEPEAPGSLSPSPESLPTAAPISAPADGSPVGTIATIGAIVLGGGGLGAWWFLKRRP